MSVALINLPAISTQPNMTGLCCHLWVSNNTPIRSLRYLVIYGPPTCELYAYLFMEKVSKYDQAMTNLSVLVMYMFYLMMLLTILNWKDMKLLDWFSQFPVIWLSFLSVAMHSFAKQTLATKKTPTTYQLISALDNWWQMILIGATISANHSRIECSR